MGGSESAIFSNPAVSSALEFSAEKSLEISIEKAFEHLSEAQLSPQELRVIKASIQDKSVAKALKVNLDNG
jgi:ribosomal protein L22